jgi:hypothetical protein
LDAEKALTDFSSIGKMRDEYPLTIFTLSNAMFVGQSEGADSFLYLLIYGLWTDALVNPRLSIALRIFFLQVALIMLSEIYMNMTTIAGLTEKKSKGSPGLFFAARGKLRRMMLTVAGVLYAIEKHPDHLGLDRIGSHIEENYIGIIRQLCHQNNQKDRVFHATARYEYIRSRFDELCFPHHVAKRVNFGGVRVGAAGYYAEFPAGSLAFVGSLFRGLSMPTKLPETNTLDEVIDFLLTVAAATPYQKARFSGDLAGHLIVARLVTFHRPAPLPGEEGVESRRVTRTWSDAETEALKEGMLQHLKDIELLPRLDKTLAQIGRKRRDLINGAFGLRKWAEGEFTSMLQCVRDTRENWKIVEFEFSRPRAVLRKEYEDALQAQMP